MDAPGAFLLVFHLSLNAYELPVARLKAPCAKAALGEYVPAKPPDSFHATSWSAPPLTLAKMPRSWLKPALAVHRSALALSTATSLAGAVRLSASRLPSMSDHADPLLPCSRYCRELDALNGPLPATGVGDGDGEGDGDGVTETNTSVISAAPASFGVAAADFRSVAICVSGTTCAWHRAVLVRTSLK